MQTEKPEWALAHIVHQSREQVLDKSRLRDMVAVTTTPPRPVFLAHRTGALLGLWYGRGGRAIVVVSL